MTRPEYPDHAQNAIDAIEEALAGYHEICNPAALKEALQANRATYWLGLEEDVKLGLLTEQEAEWHYQRHL